MCVCVLMCPTLTFPLGPLSHCRASLRNRGGAWLFRVVTRFLFPPSSPSVRDHPGRDGHGHGSSLPAVLALHTVSATRDAGSSEKKSKVVRHSLAFRSDFDAHRPFKCNSEKRFPVAANSKKLLGFINSCKIHDS